MTDPLLIPAHISRTFIQSHPNWIFVYSFDVVGKSFFGQANAAHGEPNAYPVPVMYKFCASSAVYFQDSRIDEQWNYIITALEKIPTDKGPIIPFRRMGQGCARMQEFAPKMLAEMNKILSLKAAPIEWVWRHT